MSESVLSYDEICSQENSDGPQSERKICVPALSIDAVFFFLSQ